MKNYNILLCFVLGCSLYGAENITINADTSKAYYDKYLEDDNIFQGYYNFNPGKTSRSYSNNIVTWNGTPPEMGKDKDGRNVGVWVYGGLNNEYMIGNRNASNNKVYINGGELQAVYGGSAETGGASVSNSVVIDGKDVHVIQNVYGGYTNSSTSKLESNSVTIKNGTIDQSVMGAYAIRGLAQSNSVTIEGGTIGKDVRGGYAEGEGQANGNTVTIRGGTIKGNIYGGKGSSGNINNTVNLDASSLKLQTIYGGDSGWNGFAKTTKGNTLNVRGKNIEAGNIVNFEYINFYLPSDVKAGDTILNLSGKTAGSYSSQNKNTDLARSFLAVTMGAENRNLNVNDKITLITNPYGILYPKEFKNHNKNLQAIAGISTIYEFDLKKDGDDKADSGKNLYAVVTKKVSPLSPNDGSKEKKLVETMQKSTLEPTAGAMAVINQGSETASNMDTSGVTGSSNSNGGMVTGASASNTRQHSGSYVDVKSISFAVGVAKEFKDVITGAFLEFGGGNYDTFNEYSGTFNGREVGDIRGEGKMRYYGTGLLGKVNLPANFYTEATIKIGKIKTDYKTVLPTGVKIGYDASRGYYGGHVGLGKIFEITDFSNIDIYSKVFFTRVGKKQVELNSERILLGKSDSLKAKIGFKFSQDINDGLLWFAGLAYDREFNGKSNGYNLTYSTDIVSPSMKGNTGTAELGLKFKAQKGFETNLKFEGMTGKREGIAAAAEIMYKF
ncbi:autotransporter outer membrane beta-barrel domain-containing protein [Campylobacter concisus]|nr:autotransporter outer membrane beta-barrel domain-containing protein [Campylobacter concisus]